MLKKEMILKTAVCYWSAEDECYAVESPFFPPVIAAERTPAKTFKVYKSMLNSTYEELLKDRVHGFKRGRPTKNGVELHVQVQSDTKQMIDELRKGLGLSQGEFVDLATFYYAKKGEPAYNSTTLSPDATISELLDALQIKAPLPLPKRKLQKAVG